VLACGTGATAEATFLLFNGFRAVDISADSTVKLPTIGSDADKGATDLPPDGADTSLAAAVATDVSITPTHFALADNYEQAPNIMFSEEQRLHVLQLCVEGYTVDEVATLIVCSSHSIDCWRRAMAAAGSLRQVREIKNSHADAALRKEDLVRAVKRLVEEEPVVFLGDHIYLLVTLSTYYPDVDHRCVSSVTVYLVLRHVGYTRNQLERLFLEHSEQEQREVAIMTNQLPLRCLVRVDETHTDGGDMLLMFFAQSESRPAVLDIISMFCLDMYLFSPPPPPSPTCLPTLAFYQMAAV